MVLPRYVPKAGIAAALLLCLSACEFEYVPGRHALCQAPEPSVWSFNQANSTLHQNGRAYLFSVSNEGLFDGIAQPIIKGPAEDTYWVRVWGEAVEDPKENAPSTRRLRLDPPAVNMSYDPAGAVLEVDNRRVAATAIWVGNNTPEHIVSAPVNLTDVQLRTALGQSYFLAFPISLSRFAQIKVHPGTGVFDGTEVALPTYVSCDKKGSTRFREMSIRPG